MKKLLILVLLFLFVQSFKAFSQSYEQGVEKVIKTLFVAMEKGDSALAHTTFANKITGATVFKDKTGNTVLQREDSMNEFLKAIGSPHKDIWYEEIWNLKIQMDGDFAQAWCDYAFYVGNNFSHCGIDAFHLFNDKGNWKIFHLADTRRKTGCEIPEEIKAKHKP